ncbi:MAG: ribonuclease H-like domain-containing protein [Acidobacteria bacterium]|nr:ribonuclease H-like domain-containing protein [Acidobacteriota bacterium]
MTERWSGAGRRRYLVREIRWPLDHRHGNWQVGSLREIPPASLRFLAGGAGGRSLDPQECLFLDTETTGLAGGAGTVVFLTGCVWLERDRLVLRHLFVPDFPGEAAMIDELAQLLEQFSCVVTFNGKSYDLPLLQTRFTLHRKSLDTSRWAQVDLLHAARVLWKRPLGACSLVALERSVLGFHRAQDIPSRSIPRLYFEFLRWGRLERLRGVFDHNMWDLLTCAGLLSRIAAIVGGKPGTPHSFPGFLPSGVIGSTRCPQHEEKTAKRVRCPPVPFGIDHVRLARFLWSRGETARALDHCRLAGDCSGLELEGQIRKRVKDPRARQTWEDLIQRPEYRGLQAFWELSLLAERQEKNPQLALQLLEQALARRHVGSEAESRKLLRRRERLQRRLAVEHKPAEGRCPTYGLRASRSSLNQKDDPLD